MVIKFLGAVFIMLSTTLIGLIYSYKNDYRVYELNEVKKMLSVLSSEINFGLSTMPEALKTIATRVEMPLKLVIEQILKDMLDNREGGLAVIWRENFIKMDNTYLNNDDISVIADMSKTLGYADSSIQLRSIAEVEKYIDFEISEIYKSNSKTKKMYQSMGVLCGMLVVIVLI